MMIAGKLYLRELTSSDRDNMMALYEHLVVSCTLSHYAARIVARQQKLEVPPLNELSNNDVIKQLRRTLRFFDVSEEKMNAAVKTMKLDFVKHTEMFVALGLIEWDTLFKPVS